jgi:hypothetical protein
VAAAQDVLVVNGFLRALSASERGHYGPITASAVSHFQQTHLGPDRTPLRVTGEIDQLTWWALDHASGEDQRSHITTRIPAGLTPKRIATLTKALELHARNIREQPNGSNRGPEVDRFLPSYLIKGPPPPPGPPWCCFSAMWVLREVLGKWPLGGHLGSVWRTHVIASKRGMVRETPTPGDLFVMLYRDDSGAFSMRGHIGFVLRADSDKINTLEGNVGNRFALSRREQSTIHCYVDPYDDTDERPVAWERGTVAPALAVANLSTR